MICPSLDDPAKSCGAQHPSVMHRLQQRPNEMHESRREHISTTIVSNWCAPSRPIVKMISVATCATI